jgi:hypothetical protein
MRPQADVKSAQWRKNNQVARRRQTDLASSFFGFDVVAMSVSRLRRGSQVRLMRLLDKVMLNT